MEQLSVDSFFDRTNNEALWPLFQKVNYVWELVAHIPRYIESIFVPKILGEVEEGAWLEPNGVHLAEGAKVERGAIVRGPTIIGEGTIIRSGSVIRGHAMFGKQCVVGVGTEVRQTILLNHSNLPHKNTVFCSILGNDVNMAGGNTTNKRLDGKEIIIRIPDESGGLKSFPTGLDRFGAVIGDHCRLGGMCVLVPGAIISKNCVTYPLISIGGYLPPGTLLKTSNIIR